VTERIRDHSRPGAVELGLHRTQHRRTGVHGTRDRRIGIRNVRRDVMHDLRELKNEFGKTIVMVTHDPRALRFVDHAFHLDKGILLEGEEAERADRAVQLAAGGHLISAAGGAS